MRVDRFLVALAIVMSAPVATGSRTAAAACWLPPVAAAVSDPYREPACRWCPGNRGIEYASAEGDPVRAVASGTVTFSGTIAGATYVVIEHADGRRATYGGLGSSSHRRDDTVVAGTRVGLAAGPVHFGLRDGERYLDPTPMMGVLDRPPRLVPTDGSPGLAAPAATLRCGAQRPDDQGVRIGSGPR